MVVKGLCLALLHDYDQLDNAKCDLCKACDLESGISHGLDSGGGACGATIGSDNYNSLSLTAAKWNEMPVTQR